MGLGVRYSGGVAWSADLPKRDICGALGAWLMGNGFRGRGLQ